MVKMTPVNDSFATAKNQIQNKNYFYKLNFILYEGQEKWDRERNKQLNDMIKMTPNAICDVLCMYVMSH